MTKPILTQAIYLKDAPPALVQWIEQQLARGGYLAADQVNTTAGSSTFEALSRFKEDAQLDYPKAIGQTTIDALAALEPRHLVSEQSLYTPTKLNPQAGTKTGKSATLPLVGLVYANQEVVEGIPLTWGEMLRDFQRMPAGSDRFGSEEDLVRRMLALARAFGKCRDKFGSPIGINSAYRPFSLPIGASRSQHKFGRGLDMRPMNGDYSGLLAAMKSVEEFTGIGLAGAKKGFWHGDIRPVPEGGDRVYFRY